MTFSQSIQSCFKNYFNAKGRASRSEYWYFTLFQFLVMLPLALFFGVSSTLNIFYGYKAIFILSIILFVCGVLLFIAPNICVFIRRMHDIGKSGWWYLLNIVPGIISLIIDAINGTLFNMEDSQETYPLSILIVDLIGFVIFILILVWLCKDTQNQENKYGDIPQDKKEDFGIIDNQQID
jgi:uncharacterized membrane protein YhaH (DUF805 family)